MPTPNHAYDDVEAFRKWVESNSVQGIAAQGAPHNKFLPYPLLKQHFTKDNNAQLKKLVYKCCPDEPCSDIVDVILANNFVCAFAILLLIYEGSLIIQFIRNDGLSDLGMPFRGEAPKYFPHSSLNQADANVFERFKLKQWIFFPAHVEPRTKHLETEHILPITDIQKLESGGSAETCKIVVHPDYNRLQNASVSPTSSVRQT